MLNIGIVGATGYTGIELLRILALHPEANVVAITSSQHEGQALSDVFPVFRNSYDLGFTAHSNSSLEQCDLVFFATPHATAMNMVAPLLAKGVRIIDLSADYRLNNATIWEDWYQVKHASPELLADAVYGLPEINRNSIKDAQLIANPGCYPTAISLAVIPLLKAKAINTDSIIADAKSGVSGAGRKAATGSLFAEVSENFKAYGVSGHRHLPEIEQTLTTVAGTQVTLEFVPHLLPMIRGILATVYVELNDVEMNAHQLIDEYYSSEAFVDILPFQSMPDTASVRASNLCRIGVEQRSGRKRVIIISVIDNLVKGAAGQAVHNMNIAYGFPESMGIDSIAVYP